MHVITKQEITMNKEDYLKELKALRGKIDVQAEALNDLGPLPEWAYLYSTDIVNPGEFRIDIPADKKKLSLLRHIIGRPWRFHSVTKSTIDGHSWYMYRHRTGVMLEIDLDPRREGSMCSFVKVGEKTVSVFEVQCNEA